MGMVQDGDDVVLAWQGAGSMQGAIGTVLLYLLVRFLLSGSCVPSIDLKCKKKKNPHIKGNRGGVWRLGTPEGHYSHFSSSPGCQLVLR